MNAVIYCRVSTAGQAESGLGLDAQEAAARTAATSAGLEVVGVFRDEGVSGGCELARRDGWIGALAALEGGGVLVVARRDRVARDPLVMAMAEASLKRCGSSMLSAAGEGTGSDDPVYVLMRRMVDAFAEYERLMICARTRAALRAKLRRGMVAGTVPYGYREGDEGVLIEDAGEQAIILAATELRAAGRTFRQIEAELLGRGLRPRSGREEWNPNQIRRLLQPLEERAPAMAAATGGDS